MDKKDQDTILRSSPELKKFLDLNPRFLHLLQDGCRVFSQQMMTDILVSCYFATSQNHL